MARFVAGRLERIYPDLAGIQFEYIWKGTAALNRHWLPGLYETAPDWYALTTCNGRGMALSTITGQMFGKALAGGNIGDYVLPCAAPPSGITAKSHRWRTGQGIGSSGSNTGQGI